MTRTPDEIKKGLECCTMPLCAECPYDNEPSCVVKNADALALIRWHEEKNEAMHAEIVRLQAERDAAVVCIGKLTVILKKYPYAATNGCAYEAYMEIKKYIEAVRGVQKEE